MRTPAGLEDCTYCWARIAHHTGNRHRHRHALAAVGGRNARPPPGKCAGGPAVDLPVSARRIELLRLCPSLVRHRCALVAEVLGRHASIALSSARQEESLQRAIEARTLVGQAQGIIMERFDLDRESAFEGYVATPRTPI
jgi:hypothetical protein